MINMMYLVLTALLALNVSVEVLNAFKTVNHSIEKSNQVIDELLKIGNINATSRNKMATAMMTNINGSSSLTTRSSCRFV